METEEDLIGFCTWLIGLFENLPNSRCVVQGFLNSYDDSNGEHFVTPYGMHRIMLKTDECMKGLPECVSLLSHEAMHSGLYDIVQSLIASEILSVDSADLLEERAASIAGEIVLKILKNYDIIKKNYDDIKSL